MDLKQLAHVFKYTPSSDFLPDINKSVAGQIHWLEYKGQWKLYVFHTGKWHDITPKIYNEEEVERAVGLFIKYLFEIKWIEATQEYKDAPCGIDDIFEGWWSRNKQLINNQ